MILDQARKLYMILDQARKLYMILDQARKLYMILDQARKLYGHLLQQTHWYPARDARQVIRPVRNRAQEPGCLPLVEPPLACGAANINHGTMGARIHNVSNALERLT